MRIGWPVTCSTATSAPPGTVRMTAATSAAFETSASRSVPKTFTAMSARTPDTISLIRCSIGCVNQTIWPGIPSTTPLIASTSPACVRAAFQRSRGFSAMNMSVPSSAPASVATSGVPTRLHTRSTSSGKASRIARSSRVFIRTDSSRLVPGARMIPRTMSPSESFGTNSVPSDAARRTVIPSSTTERIASVPRAERQARSSGL